MYRTLFILNCVLIALMIIVSATGYWPLIRTLQVAVFLLSVYLFYSYTKHKNRRKR